MDQAAWSVPLGNINMNRRVAIIIGAVLVLIGLASLGYTGYVLFGGAVGDSKTASSQFYLEQAKEIDPADEQRHVVVVYGTLTPPADKPSAWACAKRVWDWGDGVLTRQSDCTMWVSEAGVVFTGDHAYTAAGKYTVKLYLQNEKGVTYQSTTLEVRAS